MTSNRFIKESVKIGDNKKNFPTKKKMLVAGLITGFLNGLFGGGGGMILVPMLTERMGLEVKKAHATAIMIILPLSIFSSFFYLFNGSFDFNIGLPVSIGVIGGGIAGALLLKVITPKKVSIIFYALMAVAGLKMLLF
jgi:uncharacterized membrane protein YfcA